MVWIKGKEVGSDLKCGGAEGREEEWCSQSRHKLGKVVRCESSLFYDIDQLVECWLNSRPPLFDLASSGDSIISHFILGPSAW
jgi:hypothetical protein